MEDSPNNFFVYCRMSKCFDDEFENHGIKITAFNADTYLFTGVHCCKPTGNTVEDEGGRFLEVNRSARLIDMSREYSDWLQDTFIKDGGDLTDLEGLADHCRDRLEVMMMEIVSGFARLYHYVYYSDNYFTEVRPKVKKKGGGNKARQAKLYGPSILVLNRIPSHSDNTEGEHATKKKYHHRRGHFKTLTHEKFRHHPKFGVKNGVYVKPAWIGEKEGTYQGRSYKVLVPVEDN
jgi:hypothetical protein